MFEYRLLTGETVYTGRELRTGWVRSQTNIAGDAAAAFFGPCNVATVDLVDEDDRRAGATIEAARMLHIIIEHPGCSLVEAVLRQRLLVCILGELLAEQDVAGTRDGDDIYIRRRKLTVSVAAPGPAASLIHLGVNVDASGAPVPAVGLAELGVDPIELTRSLLERYSKELESAAYATTKVRAVS